MGRMAGPTRRQLLGVGLTGSVFLAIGAVGLGLRRGAEHPVPELAAFEPRAFRTLQALAARTCPGSLSGFPAAAEVGLALQIDAYVAKLHPTDQRELNQALQLLENALPGFLTSGRISAFSVSSPDAQDATLRAWRDHPLGLLRKVYNALTTLCIGVYYALPEVQAAVGYPGAPDYGQINAPAIQPAQRWEQA